MTTSTSNGGVRRQLDLLVRRERGRLVADLVSRLGSSRIDLAEDVAQDALLAAMAHWPYRGLPQNPAAWLARVARNKAIDRLRRMKKEAPYAEHLDRREQPNSQNLFAAEVGDPELRLMILCCNSELSEMDRLALTLKVVSGFSGSEIAGVFLVSENAMAQRLARAKRRLRAADADIGAAPSRFEIRARLPTILKVVYLMFSLGYSPRSGDQLIRRDVAFESLRLAGELAQRKLSASPEARALAALLCFHASRFDAREDENGKLILLRDQSRSRWDKALIADGLRYLDLSKAGEQVSRYHLEAGIAATHAAAPSWESCDWSSIVIYYDNLVAMLDSPVVVVSACVARAMNGDAEAALRTLDELRHLSAIRNYSPYFVARAEVLCRLNREAEAQENFRFAIECGASEPVLRHLEQRLAACT